MRRASVRSSATWRGFVAAALASATLAGCAASRVNRGADFYMQGRYIDADQLFEQTEPGLAHWNVDERARYALYRGATYLALGDFSGAQRWLGYGSRLGGPAVFSDEERGLLRDSLRTLGGNAGWGAAAGATTVGVGLAAQAVRLGP